MVSSLGFQLLEFYSTGIKHGFSCINLHRVLREMLKTKVKAQGCQHLPQRNLVKINAFKENV